MKPSAGRQLKRALADKVGEYTGTDDDEGRALSLTPLEQARRIAAIAAEKLAEEVVVLDMRSVCVYTDFFVICSGRNPRQVKAISDEVHGQMKRKRLFPRAVDGQTEAHWIVADYFDVVLHVFTPETRAFYKLEDLWRDVPQIALAFSAGDSSRTAEPSSGAA